MYLKSKAENQKQQYVIVLIKYFILASLPSAAPQPHKKKKEITD